MTQTTSSYVFKDNMDPQNMWGMLSKTFGIHKHTHIQISFNRWILLYTRQATTAVRTTLESNQPQFRFSPSTCQLYDPGQDLNASVCKMGVMVLPIPNFVKWCMPDTQHFAWHMVNMQQILIRVEMVFNDLLSWISPVTSFLYVEMVFNDLLSWISHVTSFLYSSLMILQKFSKYATL